MIFELISNYKITFGVIFIVVAFPLYRLVQFILNTCITLTLKRRNIYRYSNFAFLELFAPDGTRKLLEGIVDSEGNLKSKVIDLGPHLDGKPTYGITDADSFRDLLNTDKFSKLDIVYNSLELLLGNGLVTSSGDLWRRQRRLLTPLFHFKNLSTMPDIMNRRIIQFVDSLQKRANENKLGTGVEILPILEFSKLTLKIVIDCVFGGEEYFDADKMAPRWEMMNKSFNSFFFSSLFFGHSVNKWIPFPWNIDFIWQSKQIKKDIQKAIDKKRKEIESGKTENISGDLLSSLLMVRDEATGEAIPDSLIVDEAITFLFAGHDTTSSLLSFAMTFLARNENVVQKMRDEINSTIGDRLPQFSDLSHLPYCTNVAKETLRMRPPVPLLDRRSVYTTTVCDQTLPADAYVYPIFIGAHYDSRYWVDPFTFNPDRFADSKSDRNPFSFVPFSANARNCIGQKFAMMEATLALAAIITRFDVITTFKPSDDCWHFEGTMKPIRFTCSFIPLS